MLFFGFCFPLLFPLLVAKEFTFHGDLQQHPKLLVKKNPQTSWRIHCLLWMCHLPGSLPAPILESSPEQSARRPVWHTTIRGTAPARAGHFSLLLPNQGEKQQEQHTAEQIGKTTRVCGFVWGFSCLLGFCCDFL